MQRWDEYKLNFFFCLFILKYNFPNNPKCLPIIGEELLSLTRLFADDASLGYSNSSLDTLELVINHDLNKLSIWSEKWLMLINSDKTEIFKYGNTE
jgi:hypothetical protein